jgi:hypothetical protein
MPVLPLNYSISSIAGRAYMDYMRGPLSTCLLSKRDAFWCHLLYLQRDTEL